MNKNVSVSERAELNKTAREIDYTDTTSLEGGKITCNKHQVKTVLTPPVTSLIST